MPTPDRTAQSDQFYAMCQQIVEHYESAIEHDLNVYVEKHKKPMDMTFAHHDLTRILFKDIEPANLAGMVAYAVLREIGRKTGGR